MSSEQSSGVATLEPARATDDDGLHHVCAVHTYENDQTGRCEAGDGCRSLCGRDLTAVRYCDYTPAGEQPCVVCFQMDEDDG